MEWDDIKIYVIFSSIILVTIIVGYIVNRSNDPTNYIFLRRVILGLIYIVGFSLAIYIVPNLRTLAKSMLAGAGILAVAIGFASQHALSNVISGVFIVFFRILKMRI